MEAAVIVGSMTTDEEVIAGAVLHDAVEDTDTSVEDVIAVFGERVGSLVASESENKREDFPAESTWKIRKQETLNHLVTAPIEVKMITLGDKLSNI
jgi:myo-inositol-1(or 4)-monophosphatase